MIVVGDARAIPLANRSVQCVVTSPPYWGLRDYGNAAWVGGEDGCDHLERVGGTDRSTLGPESGGHYMTAEAMKRSTERSFVPYRDVCGRCGASRVDAGIGLEPTFGEYLDRMVGVFAEVWRVLRDDGIAWVNMGDSYASSGGHTGNGATSARLGRANLPEQNRGSYDTARASGLKAKDLVGQPWRLAFALQDAGWYLRSDVIWAKPNPMPESVRDRPTKGHEYLFMLTKRPRYFYDADAVREPQTSADNRDRPGSRAGVSREDYEAHRPAGELTRERFAMRDRSWNPAGRNLRTVWTIPSAPFSEAHFATFPPALVEPAIKASTVERSVVLDPFAGSGTTGVVARRLGRRFVGVELNPEYAAMARRRIAREGRLIQPRSLRADGVEELRLFE